MKRISILAMGIALVGAVALTSCGSKGAKDETKTECCEKKDSSACCEKKDSTACCEKKDSTAACCEKKDSTACTGKKEGCDKSHKGHDADSAKKCCGHKHN